MLGHARRRLRWLSCCGPGRHHLRMRGDCRGSAADQLLQMGGITIALHPDGRERSLDFAQVVGASAYFARHAPPKKPQNLTGHACINLRLPTRGGLYAWEFQKGKRRLNVHVEGQLVCNRPAGCSTRTGRGWGWRMCWKTWRGRTSPTAASGGCLKTGVRRSPAITCTTRVATRRPRHSRCWLRRCVVAIESLSELDLAPRADLACFQVDAGVVAQAFVLVCNCHADTFGDREGDARVPVGVFQ